MQRWHDEQMSLIVTLSWRRRVVTRSECDSWRDDNDKRQQNIYCRRLAIIDTMILLKKKKKMKKKEGIKASEILLLHCRLVSCVLALKQAYLTHADSAWTALPKQSAEDVGLQSRCIFFWSWTRCSCKSCHPEFRIRVKSLWGRLLSN